MKTLGTVGLMLVPVILGAISGWLYSDWVVGHTQSGSADWFDLRPLDPFFAYLQNLIFSVFFGMAGLIAFMIARAFLANQLADDRRSFVATSVASLLVCGFTAVNVMRVGRAREEHREELINQFAVKNVQNRPLRQEQASPFSKLGWVRYPNLRTDDSRTKDGFEVRESTASFTPSDDSETVANYYLSRCESWQEEPEGFSAVVRNDGADFLVLLSTQERGIDSIETTGFKPRAHMGTTHWSAGKVPADNPQPPNPLIYAGAVKTELSDSLRQFTTDDIVKVLGFYRSVGARQIDGAEDDSNKHSLEFGDEPAKQTIYIAKINEMDGTQGTLIIVHKGH